MPADAADRLLRFCSWMGPRGLLVGLLSLGAPGLVLAQAPIVLSEGGAAYHSVGPHAEILEEPPSASWSLADVRSPRLAGQFEPSPDRVVARGYQSSAYWLRFQICRMSADPSWVLEIANKSLDHVTLAVSDSTGIVQTVHTGDARPFRERPVRHRNFVIPLPEEGAGLQTVHLRVASHGPMIVPLHLWSQAAFQQKVREGEFLLGLFYGILLIMAVYNFFLYTALNDRSYLYYVLYILSYVAYQLSVERVAAEHLWPDSLWWSDRANSTLAIFCAIWGIQFSRTFLYTRRLLPRMDVLLRGLLIVCVPLLGLTLAVGGSPGLRRLTVLFFVLLAGSLGVAAVTCWLRGSRPARYYVIAWGFLLAGTVMTLLTYLGVLPYDFWTLRGVQIGSVLEVTLLSIGLGARYNALRTERARMRLRIASDLHDDIGSGLTQISLYSELAARSSGPEAAEWNQKIGALARVLVDRMQDIVWSIQPAEESWEALELRMKDHATSLLGPKDIDFDMTGEAVSETVDLAPDERQNVLLMFKEALHNAVRHANCTTVQVRWRLSRRRLQLNICDDGQGFEPSSVDRGHGLKSMEQRATELGGTLTFTTAPGAGTCVEMEIPLRDPSAPGWDQRSDPLSIHAGNGSPSPPTPASSRAPSTSEPPK